MTNKVKACAIIDNAYSGKVKYVALLYIKNNEFSKVEIYDISTDDKFYSILNYIGGLDNNLSIDNKNIISVLAFDSIAEFGSIMIGLGVNRFDNEEIWGEDNES